MRPADYLALALLVALVAALMFAAPLQAALRARRADAPTAHGHGGPDGLVWHDHRHGPRHPWDHADAHGGDAWRDA